MIRDITMIGSVLLSVISLVFGVYKNIEASNAKNFAYQQAYQVMNTVQQASIAPAAKATILSAALSRLKTPPPVIDFSQSSAAVPVSQACTEAVQAQCSTLAASLASANTLCEKNKQTGPACDQATVLQHQILTASCIACYPH